MRFPFEVPISEIQKNPDSYVESVFVNLQSEFLILPKGPGFIEYSVFEKGYEALKRATQEFSDFTPKTVFQTVIEQPISFIVLRSILGFTPPEWAHQASQKAKEGIDQGFARTLDRKIRMAPFTPLKPSELSTNRLKAMIETACQLVLEGAPAKEDSVLHRLEKVDTGEGLSGLQNLGRMGVPYAMLLYERFLGRPFAGHRDSISGLKGDALESAIEEVLDKAGISYRKTKRAEKIPGFDQAPDFMIPSEFNPQIIIEAKITEDDGTARDKVTRIQHLGTLSERDQLTNQRKYEVIACIDGRGFGVRREDMKKILLATQGKVFTAKTLPFMVKNTKLHLFQTRNT